MANRWHDGFARYGGDTSKMLNGSSSQAWAEVSMTLSSTQPRTGAWALRYNPGTSGGEMARRVFGAPLTEVFFGVAIYCVALPETEPAIGSITPGGVCLAQFRDAANSAQVSVYLGTDGSLVTYLNGSYNGAFHAFAGTLLDRTVPLIGAGAYQHLEFYLKPHASAGAVEVRVDEVTRVNLSGINTRATANTEASQIALGRTDPGTCLPTGGGHVYFADAFVNDTADDGGPCNTFIGDCKSGDRPPVSDTAQADFSLSTGAFGYALIDERPPVDGDYLSLAGSTGESDFGIAAGPANTTEILNARPWVRGWKDDAGTCTITPSLKSGGTKATVTAQPIATAAAYYDSCVPLDPDTGLPWTLAGLDAADLVIERTA